MMRNDNNHLKFMKLISGSTKWINFQSKITRINNYKIINIRIKFPTSSPILITWKSQYYFEAISSNGFYVLPHPNFSKKFPIVYLFFLLTILMNQNLKIFGLFEYRKYLEI